MPRPTIKQSRAEAAKLREMKPKVRQYTAFNEDNHAAIDAQAEVIERLLSENDIYDTWESGEDPCQHTLDAALEARRWLDGEEDESPSSGWEPLARD